MNKKDFEKLKPGMMLQNKKDKNQAFIVSQVFPERIIAVRTIAIDDPKDWEVIEEHSEETKIVIHSAEYLREMAHKLQELLKSKPWFQMVGEGANKLVVYTSQKKMTDVQVTGEFEGVLVEYHYMGKIAPLGGNDER